MALHRVHRPERFWLASRADTAGWLTDPDVDDGYVRHPDVAAIDWLAVAMLVADAGERIATGTHELDEDGFTSIDVDVSTLAEGEREIIRWWLHGKALSPTADPWSLEPVDGRHRLWNAWEAAPSAVLPILSEALGYVDDYDEVPNLGAVGAMEIEAGLAMTPRTVLTRSPQYAAELHRIVATYGEDRTIPVVGNERRSPSIARALRGLRRTLGRRH